MLCLILIFQQISATNPLKVLSKAKCAARKLQSTIKTVSHYKYCRCMTVSYILYEVNDYSFQSMHLYLLHTLYACSLICGGCGKDSYTRERLRFLLMDMSVQYSRTLWNRSCLLRLWENVTPC